MTATKGRSSTTANTATVPDTSNTDIVEMTNPEPKTNGSTVASRPEEMSTLRVPTQVDRDKHIAKRLKAQKKAERVQARVLAERGGSSIGDRQEKERKVREEIDAVYKRRLGKATGLEIEVSGEERFDRNMTDDTRKS